MIANTANAYTTDAAYEVTLKNNYDTKSFILSFYNVLTLIYAELSGRFYGGGVLELTPTEFKSLPLPYVEVDETTYTRFAKRFSDKSSILDFFRSENVAHLGLQQSLNADADCIAALNRIHQKLLTRRVNKR